MWVAGAAALAVILAAAITLTGGSDDSNAANVRSAMLAAGCTYKDVNPLPPKNRTNFHADVPSLSAKVKWSTSPPAAGGHWQSWAVWGFYTDAPVNPRQAVHNEEHGGVVIWWGPNVPAATVSQLEAFYNEKPAAMLGTPFPGLGDKIALTAWSGDPSRYYAQEDLEQPDGTTKKVGYYGVGHIAVCPRFDEEAFRTFRDAYRGAGPEGVPLDASQPGTGG
jgi:hypothetical protein